MNRKQNKWCFVARCTSTSFSTPNKTFVTVPQDNSRKKMWFKAARRDIPESKSKFLCCEDHFNFEEDVENYLRYKMMGSYIIMKKDVVPHIFDCQADRKRASTSTERPLVLKRKRKKLIEYAIREQDSMAIAGPSTHHDDVVEEAVETGDPMEWAALTTTSDVPQATRSIGVQVRPLFRSRYVQCHIKAKTQTIVSSPFTVIKKDISTSPLSKLGGVRKVLFQREPIKSSSTESGSSSFEFTETESASEVDFPADEKDDKIKALIVTRSLVTKKPKHYIGVPNEWFPLLLRLSSSKTSISEDHIMLTLIKIKLNDSFSRLGDMFGVSVSYSSKIFHQTLSEIENHLKTFILWPSGEKIKYFLPIPFRARYSNVQSIIDCLEIEKPTDPIKQALTWSEYKKCNTLKYLVSSTPDGFINFISNGYGGRITDSLLVQECWYLEYVPANCSVMADRGFKGIGKLLHSKNCFLIRPPSVSASLKPTRSEVLETKRLASLRIHIERVIRRIREFEYLKPHSVVNTNLIKETDSVITIACALINLQSPIIK